MAQRWSLYRSHCILTAIFMQNGLETPLNFTWRRGETDMPFVMEAHVQSVFLDGRVYVGGGDTWKNVSHGYVVFAYHISSEKWSRLMPYPSSHFAMTLLCNQLLLVGGWRRGTKSRAVGVWSFKDKDWTRPYPEMATARGDCSAVSREGWLAVVGGRGEENELLSSVEVLDSEKKQWFTAVPAPVGLVGMRTALVGGVCYFMGGYTGVEGDRSATAAHIMYSVSLPGLLPAESDSEEASSSSSLDTEKVPNSNGEHSSVVWREISGVGATRLAPLSLGGSLLAMGGQDVKCGSIVRAIHLYRPGAGRWEKVGDLPAPRCDCTCVAIDQNEFLVAGGSKKPDSADENKFVRIIDIAELL